MVILMCFVHAVLFALSSVYRKLVSKKTETERANSRSQDYNSRVSLLVFHNSLISRMKNEAENGNIHDNCCHGCCWAGEQLLHGD